MSYANNIADSIGLASDTNAYDILITGDFNWDIADNRSRTKITDLCQEYGLNLALTLLISRKRLGL